MLRGVTFDLWQTLIFDTAEQEERRKQKRVNEMLALLTRRDFTVTHEELAGAHESVWTRCSEFWRQNRDVSAREQTVFFLEEAGVPSVSTMDESFLAEAEGIYTSGIEAAPPHIMPAARETLSELAARGLKLGLICNTGRTPGYRLRVLLERYLLLRYFEVLTFSDELKIRKPDARVFEGTLKKLGVSAAESVHIGDDPTTDVRGAKSAGMLAILLEHNDTVRPVRRPPTFALAEAEPSLLHITPDAVIKSLAELPQLLSQGIVSTSGHRTSLLP